MANRMTVLLDKIERRLGTKPLNLPDFLKKDQWATEVLIPDTITTFSRYFPNLMTISIDTSQTREGYYLIDENVCESVDILGIRDINWSQFGKSAANSQQGMGYGSYDMYSSSYNMEDASLLQMRADHSSLFSNGIYLDFKPPNMLKLTSVMGVDISKNMSSFPIDILIKHSDNLMTIAPTKMEAFENLAISDVAVFLFQFLKHFDGLETVFASVDLKLSYLEEKANRRDEYVQDLQDGYISAANENQPFIFTV